MEFLASIPVVLVLTALTYVAAGRIVDLQVRAAERQMHENGQAATDAACPEPDSAP